MADRQKFSDYDATAANNDNVGGVDLREGVMTKDKVNDALREMLSHIKEHFSEGTIASASTCDIGGEVQGYLNVTGTTTITSFGTVDAGTGKLLVFAGALTLTHNATSLILPGGANITTAAGDTALMVSEGSGNWRCVVYQTADGRFVVTPVMAQINDANGNEALKLPATASAVNEITLANAATGNGPKVQATGDDTNIDLELEAKGTGAVEINAPKLTLGSDAEGDIFYRGSEGKLVRLPIGTAGQLLKVNTGATAPEWGDANSWTELAPVATTSGTAIDFTSLPTGISELELWFDGASRNSTSSEGLIQIGSGGSPKTTGYDSGAGASGNSSEDLVSTAGFIIGYPASSSAGLHGKLQLHHFGSDRWVASYSAHQSGGEATIGGGGVTLAGTLDNLRFTTTLGSTLNGGQIRLRYR